MAAGLHLKPNNGRDRSRAAACSGLPDSPTDTETNRPMSTEIKLSPNEEIRELGNMLAATTEWDTGRLRAIAARVAEFAERAVENTIRCAANRMETIHETVEGLHLDGDIAKLRNAIHQDPGWEVKEERCGQCGGMGWVPSNTEADTDPCPKCEGGFKS